MKDRMKPKFWHEYEGKSVLVFDDVFSDKAVEAFGMLMMRLDYQPRPSFDKELSAAVPNGDFWSWPRFPEAVNAILKRFYARMTKKRSPQKLSHVYGASLRYGDSTRIHRDIDCPDCVTFLYYGNLHWDPSWGGETVFFDDEKNAMYAVTPKPGRLVLFNAQIFHRTGIPMRDCPTNRYGLSVFFRCAKHLPA